MEAKKGNKGIGGGKTILVIDDDPDVLSTIVKHLKFADFQVITAKDGMEALKRVEEDEYDLVITDIVMPYISGVGVVTAVKTKDPGIPVIAITAYGKEPGEAATEKKADLVIHKPVKISVLKGHVSKLLGLESR